MQRLPGLAALHSRLTMPLWWTGQGVLRRIARSPARLVRDQPRIALCMGGDNVDRPAEATDEHRVIQFPRRTPRHVRVGLGVLAALAVWVLIILAGYALIRLMGRPPAANPRAALTSYSRASSACTAGSNISGVSRRVEVL